MDVWGIKSKLTMSSTRFVPSTYNFLLEVMAVTTSAPVTTQGTNGSDLLWNHCWITLLILVTAAVLGGEFMVN